LILNLCLLPIGILLLGSCKTLNINSEPPDQNTSVAPEIPKLPSMINVPVSLPVKEVENRLNSALTGVIYKDDNIEDDNYKMTITKKGKISVNADNNKIIFS